MTAGYSRDFDRALVLAALVHEGVPRKGTAIPYIIHPVQVATILLRHGYDETLAVAGCCTTCSKTSSTATAACSSPSAPRFLRRRCRSASSMRGTFRDAFQAFMYAEFAPDVLELVRQVTEPKNDERPTRSWRERKEHDCRAPPHGAGRGCRLKAADALHNVRSIVEDIAHHGATVLGRFSASREDTIWYYERGLDRRQRPPELGSARGRAARGSQRRCSGRLPRSLRTGRAAEFFCALAGRLCTSRYTGGNRAFRTDRARTRKQENTKTEPWFDRRSPAVAGAVAVA